MEVFIKSLFLIVFAFQASMAKSKPAKERVIYRKMTKFVGTGEECSVNLTSSLHELYNKLDSFFDKGFEYECSQIRFKSASDYHQSSTYTYELLVACTPRKLSEKVIYSMAKRCEQDPSEDCFAEDTLEKMDRVSHTTFIYENNYEEGCSTLNDY